MEKPLISIILPAYNHENYVEETIRSILCQTWPNLELLVIDDGSRDHTWDVLQNASRNVRNILHGCSWSGSRIRAHASQ